MTIESKDRKALRQFMFDMNTRGECQAGTREQGAEALAQPDPYRVMAGALRSIANDNLDYAQITALAKDTLVKVQA